MASIFGLVLFFRQKNAHVHVHSYENVVRTKITDLNHDCLEHILQYLELEDLVNAADANIQLNRAANLIFHRRYDQKEVIFGYDQDSSLNSVQRFNVIKKIKIRANSIEIIDMKIAIRLLRCFGFLISEIKLGYQNEHCNFDGELVTSINEYCIDSLTKLTIYDIPRGGIKRFIKPFKRVEDIYFLSYDKKSPWWVFEPDFLHRIFPNIRKLGLGPYDGCMPLIHNGCCAHHFPHLEHLEISCLFKCFEACRPNITECLLLNPQLKSFSAKMYFGSNIIDANILQRTYKSLQNLEQFTLHSVFDEHQVFFHNFNGEVISLKNVQSFEIEMEQGKIPFSFDRLHTLILPSSDHPFNKNIYSFIEKHSHVTKLETYRFYYEDYQQKVAKLLPFLEEIYFVYARLSTDEVIQFISMFNTLKYFRFRLKSRFSYDELLTRIGNNWSATIDLFDFNVELKRFVE